MDISIDSVRNVAKLARLKLSDRELEFFAGQLAIILEYIDQLKKVDTSGVEPTSHVLPIQNVFRKDSTGSSLTQSDVLKNTASSEGGLFKVPRVVEES
ncbi:MAG: Asp-tRNA(Asn)/Glu-tRNA(Gln) amidotransferase subunit GatC [Candidatus Omnitrophica bacterium]|nr:Asp-tRNA(Asn)/Glu-tRNA(Gln) amidotransferase subunit GatC [Candidatus Omnitrophota bacterium]